MCSDKESQEELTKEACICVDEIEKVVCRFYGRLEEAYTRPRKKAQNLKVLHWRNLYVLGSAKTS